MSFNNKSKDIGGVMVSVVECGRSWVPATVGSNQRLSN
jgi:hypothetical protein